MAKKTISKNFKTKKKSHEKFYKVLIQKTYKNNEGYIFANPDIVNSLIDNTDKSFVMVYYFKKIPNIRNPMFVVESVSGEDFKGKAKIVRHFEENHSLEYAVKCDLNWGEFGDEPKKPE